MFSNYPRYCQREFQLAATKQQSMKNSSSLPFKGGQGAIFLTNESRTKRLRRKPILAKCEKNADPTVLMGGRLLWLLF